MHGNIWASYSAAASVWRRYAAPHEHVPPHVINHHSQGLDLDDWIEMAQAIGLDFRSLPKTTEPEGDTFNPRSHESRNAAGQDLLCTPATLPSTTPAPAPHFEVKHSTVRQQCTDEKPEQPQFDDRTRVPTQGLAGTVADFFDEAGISANNEVG